jgi:hypothetical protein
MGRVRGWLGLGPSRAELRAEIALWRERREREAEEKRAAYARAKDAERVNSELRHRITNLIQAKLNEPDRAEGCGKVRFHREDEARDFAQDLATRTGQPLEVFNIYGCRICPKSPATIRRYLHVGHRGSEYAQTVKVESKRSAGARQAAARRDGVTVAQRVDPRVVAELSRTRKGQS